MSLIVPAVLGGLAITVMALVSLAAARKGKHPAAGRQPQASQQRILVHAINDDRCTGCDACVAVCPTNVLDLIANKSRVVRFQDCIQCEACMWACPTTALVMHLEGTEPPRLKAPELDANFQTAVPGQYLIGEVAGKPLVKNAANLGRLVVEHMLRSGLERGALARSAPDAVDVVDVVIVGSGPGGLSAALTCIHHGLSYVVLEKEQLVASTISRYPKGKLIMAEPYDVRNHSFLPVFDSSKEQLIPIWEELIERTSMTIKRGEAVEEITRDGSGVFTVRTTVASYLAQRVVLATGTRGKPRTLGVIGENLPKVYSLLDDPDEFRGKPVIVIGGGDSAVEAAIALADAGAKVVLSYRGNSFNRAQPKNKQTIESYEAQHRVKIRYQSSVIEITPDTVTLEMPGGQRKSYPNQAAFVLIGSDPPVKWLEKLGVRFVERPHSHSLGKSDELLVRMLGEGLGLCPEDATSAAALVLGQEAPAVPPRERAGARGEAEPLSGPRKWLRSATALFGTQRKIEQPMPLSEFARRKSKRRHTGDGRRDSLDPGERTRILRMLRDEGGRLADEDSRVSVVPASEPEPAPKQAVIVGLARAAAQAPSARQKRPAAAPPLFSDEPTLQVDSESALAQVLREESRRMSDERDPSLVFGDDEDEATIAIPAKVRKPPLPPPPAPAMRREAAGGAPGARPADELDSGIFEFDGEATRRADLATLSLVDGPDRQRGRRDEDATRSVDLTQKGAPPPRSRGLTDIEWDLD